jgi:hypothetical protein
VMRVRL